MASVLQDTIHCDYIESHILFASQYACIQCIGREDDIEFAIICIMCDVFRKLQARNAKRHNNCSAT
jgi:hypothetical protein